MKRRDPRPLSLELGGLRIVLQFVESSSTDKPCAKRAVDAERAVFTIHRGYIPEVKKEEKIFDTGSVWSLFRSDGRYVLQDEVLSSASKPETLIILDPDAPGGDIYLRKPTLNERILSDLFGHPINQLIMILLLSSRNGLIMHACGIDDGGHGYLFLGNSSHGKSTLSKLWHERGAVVLNDDRIILREWEDSIRMYGTPWHGTFPVTSLRELPLEKIFFLRHGKENRLTVKTGAEAVSMLLTRSFPPLWDSRAMEQVLMILNRMAAELPCHELHFLPDGRIIDLIRSLD